MAVKKKTVCSCLLLQREIWECERWREDKRHWMTCEESLCVLSRSSPNNLCWTLAVRTLCSERWGRLAGIPSFTFTLTRTDKLRKPPWRRNSTAGWITLNDWWLLLTCSNLDFFFIFSICALYSFILPQCLQKNQSTSPAGPGTPKTWPAAGLLEEEGRLISVRSTNWSTNSGNDTHTQGCNKLFWSHRLQTSLK